MRPGAVTRPGASDVVLRPRLDYRARREDSPLPQWAPTPPPGGWTYEQARIAAELYAREALGEDTSIPATLDRVASAAYNELRGEEFRRAEGDSPILRGDLAARRAASRLRRPSAAEVIADLAEDAPPSLGRVTPPSIDDPAPF